MLYQKFIYVLAICATLIVTQSCATHNLFEGDKTDINPIDSLMQDSNYTHLIKPDDKVSVSIWGHDDLSIGSLFGIYNSNEVYGKWVLVSKEGNVMLPKVGKVNLGGLNVSEAADTLETLYGQYIVDPNIVVKILNREVTILGEVLTPGSYLLEKEKNTLFEIISRAGGLDFYSEKRTVKLIRNDIGYELDLTKMSDFQKNNLIVQSGDIIYIPTKKGKTLDKKAPILIPITSVITTVVVVLSLFAN